jgi:hypothetical protein
MGLAKKLQMSQGSIQRWVRGTGLPTLETTVQLSAMTGCCVEWLLTGRGPERPLDPGSPLGELMALFQAVSDEGQAEILKFARYQRTIAFTGDPRKRSEFQVGLVGRTPTRPKTR